MMAVWFSFVASLYTRKETPIRFLLQQSSFVIWQQWKNPSKSSLVTELFCGKEKKWFLDSWWPFEIRRGLPEGWDATATGAYSPPTASYWGSLLSHTLSEAGVTHGFKAHRGERCPITDPTETKDLQHQHSSHSHPNNPSTQVQFWVLGYNLCF